MRSWRSAVLVTVVVVGGACGSSDGSGGAGTDANGRPKLPLGTSSGESASGGAAADDSRRSDVAASMIAPARFVEYRLADGAKAPSREAPAYKVVPVEEKGAAANVAKALDVEENQVEVQQGLGWFYSRASKDGSVSSGVAVACTPDGECPEPIAPPLPPGVPSPAEAEARFRQILSALDVDAGDGEFETLADAGPVRQVVFHPVIGGREVEGFESSIAFGENGRIEYANGFLGRFENVGTYPLIDLAKALERQQNGFGGGLRTMGAAEGGVAEGGMVDPGRSEPGSPGCAPDQKCTVDPSPPQDQPGDEPTMTIEPQPTDPTVPLEPEIVEITGADLVLQVIYGSCPEDEIYLVPAFRLLPLDSAGFSVAAVEDESLAGGGPDPEQPAEPCEGQIEPDVPVGKPEPGPLPPDGGEREPARP